QVPVLMPVLPFRLRHLDGAGGRHRVLAVGGAPVGGAPGGGAPGGGAPGGGDTVGGAPGGGDTGGGDTAGPHDPHQVAVAVPAHRPVQRRGHDGPVRDVDEQVPAVGPGVVLDLVRLLPAEAAAHADEGVRLVDDGGGTCA